MLVNIGEEGTDVVLREVAGKLGVRVLPKVRLADALDINRSGLPERPRGRRATSSVGILKPGTGRLGEGPRPRLCSP